MGRPRNPSPHPMLRVTRVYDNYSSPVPHGHVRFECQGVDHDGNRCRWFVQAWDADGESRMTHASRAIRAHKTERWEAALTAANRKKNRTP